MTDKPKREYNFKPGKSGNPAGRPPGVGLQAELRKLIAVETPAVIAELITRAKRGDSQAARLLLERVLPPIKATEETVKIDLPEGAGLTEQGEAIIAAVAAGTIAPGQGSALLGGLGALARVKEMDELERRITALEAGDGKS